MGRQIYKRQKGGDIQVVLDFFLFCYAYCFCRKKSQLSSWELFSSRMLLDVKDVCLLHIAKNNSIFFKFQIKNISIKKRENCLCTLLWLASNLLNICSHSLSQLKIAGFTEPSRTKFKWRREWKDCSGKLLEKNRHAIKNINQLFFSEKKRQIENSIWLFPYFEH